MCDVENKCILSELNSVKDKLENSKKDYENIKILKEELELIRSNLLNKKIKLLAKETSNESKEIGLYLYNLNKQLAETYEQKIKKLKKQMNIVRINIRSLILESERVCSCNNCIKSKNT